MSRPIEGKINDRFASCALLCVGVSTIATLSMGPNILSQIGFGAISAIAISKLTLLPLGLFYQEDRGKKCFWKSVEVLTTAAIGCPGLFMSTEKPPYSFLAAVAFATVVLAAPLIYEQGIKQSIGEGRGRWMDWGTLCLKKTRAR